MEDATDDESADYRATIQFVLRLGIAGLVLGPGVSKFLTYEQSVQFFRTLAIPAPAIMVVLVGGVELAVAVLLLLDRAPRASAILVIPVMVVAAATAGPTWQNLGVFAAAVGLITLETTIHGGSSPASTG
jgi:putative oxidoreductase